MSILTFYNSSLGTLNISNVLTWVEKPDIQYQIKRYPNQSVFIQIKQNPIRNYNLTVQIDNNSTKDGIYGFLGYRMDYMSYGNTSHAKVWITEYHPSKKYGDNEEWEASLKMVKET